MHLRDSMQETTMSRISVIMPVYNAQAALQRAVNSIIAQSLQDWELLIINDGSTDDSDRICDDYAKKDARIRVFHQENKGVAMARQLGVEQARGEYSIHVDADDWVEPTMLEEMFQKAIEEDVDIVIADFFSTNAHEERIVKQQPSSLLPEEVLRDLFRGKIFGGLCHKLVRHSLYEKYHACFFAGINYCEDVLIWAQLLQHKDIKMAYLSKAYYHYVMNPSSITHAYTRSTYEMRKRFQKKLIEVLPQNGYEQETANSAFGIFVEAFIYDVLKKEEIKEGLKSFQQQICALDSTRWKIGFSLLHWGFCSLAHIFIKF